MLLDSCCLLPPVSIVSLRARSPQNNTTDTCVGSNQPHPNILAGDAVAAKRAQWCGHGCTASQTLRRPCVHHRARVSKVTHAGTLSAKAEASCSRRSPYWQSNRWRRAGELLRVVHVAGYMLDGIHVLSYGALSCFQMGPAAACVKWATCSKALSKVKTTIQSSQGMFYLALETCLKKKKKNLALETSGG